ncbi:MAG: hypothetical protein KME03_01530 [Aphanocapsa lilacina HA4352-LM1]|jgi:hypothetical protein|uniref:Uncharacterized protein n=1 Tax=Gloeobacter morelensis MG652769 TaxID=2781736 RepID=A0ABY3PGP5_9CYAN|nr:hypothetical protein [Gloeobacter morelensis]MBW4696580.1 hypothetical protein [Aphanocapsa lilacina HA4352-LM1]UFP92830.1 hypothetical protein ISF26_13450 [Gloeobacter morelensis MG652769]
MSYQSKLWFQRIARELKIVDKEFLRTITVATLRPAIRSRLSDRVEEASRRGEDLQDPATWLDLVLIDAVVSLENIDGEAIRVAVLVTTRDRHALNELGLVKSQNFRAVRSALGIQRHWVILLDSVAPPSQEQLVDSLYEQIDQPGECTLIDLRS